MILSVVSIGNSKGIRLPKMLLNQCHITDQVNVEVSGKKIILEPVKKPRDGWEEQMKLMHERGEDKLLMPDTIDADLKDWEWK